MNQDDHRFNRTEIRVMQNMCGDDNEKFLNMIAELVSKRDEQIYELRQELKRVSDLKTYLQHELASVEDDLNAANAAHKQEVEQLEERISNIGWELNPDRMGGGGWTAEELDPNRGWK